jgi:hypothetical protein
VRKSVTIDEKVLGEPRVVNVPIPVPALDRWERTARVLGTLVGQVGFPILVAGFLLLKFDVTLEKLTEKFTEMTAQVQRLVEAQKQATLAQETTNSILVMRGGPSPSLHHEKSLSSQ